MSQAITQADPAPMLRTHVPSHYGAAAAAVLELDNPDILWTLLRIAADDPPLVLRAVDRLHAWQAREPEETTA